MGLWAVSGGSSFLGLHLARRLLAEDDGVRSLDLEPFPEPGVDSLVGDVLTTADAAGCAAEPTLSSTQPPRCQPAPRARRSAGSTWAGR